MQETPRLVLHLQVPDVHDIETWVSLLVVGDGLRAGPEGAALGSHFGDVFVVSGDDDGHSVMNNPECDVPNAGQDQVIIVASGHPIRDPRGGKLNFESVDVVYGFGNLIILKVNNFS